FLEKFKNKYRIKSNRLQGYDYASDGAYFLTICTRDRENLFGNIEGGKMFLNELGNIVQKEWVKTGVIRKNIWVDEFVVMPNHIHGILVIENNTNTIR
ncbi:transposase, partial [Candidatus Gracilibacteria bacterium]|nr:transposase [Candidatus Gracilibacteria bacterium]